MSPRSGRASSGTPVAEVEAAAYTIPTDAPEADGTLSWDSTTLILARVTAGGVTGTGWTYATPAAALVIRETLADVVKGTDIDDVPGTSQAMIRAVRNAGRPGLVSEAISAVDVALWDLKSRLLGLPLHRLIGAIREEVPLYGSGGFTTYDDARLTEQVEGWLGMGMGQVKIKIAEGWGARVGRDLERMRQVRRIIGDGRALFVDANGGYTRKQAVRVMEQADDLDVAWFEEPVSSDDLAGLRAVRRAVSADVAAGEYGYDLAYFAKMCQAEAVDCLQADVSRCGGITEWVRVAAVAASHGLDISGHCAPHVHAHVAATVPNLRHLEWFHDHVRIEAMAFDGVLEPRNGRLHLGAEPGLGLTWRDSDMAPYRVA